MLSLAEILTNNITNIKLKDGKIIIPEWVKHIKIDIGLSFDAPHTQNWIDNDDTLLVFGFEPNRVWFKYLTSPDNEKDRNFKDYHTYTKPLEYSNINNKAFIIPIALSDVEEPTIMKLYVPELSAGCGSLLKPTPNEKLGNVIEEYDVPVFSLKDFFDLLPMDNIEYIDYIKIDVQGKDINVLKGAGKFLTEKVVYVTAEPEDHYYVDSSHNSVSEIINYMTSIGFIHINHHNTSDPTFLNSKFRDKSNIYIWQKY